MEDCLYSRWCFAEIVSSTVYCVLISQNMMLSRSLTSLKNLGMQATLTLGVRLLGRIVQLTGRKRKSSPSPHESPESVHVAVDSLGCLVTRE